MQDWTEEPRASGWAGDPAQSLYLQLLEAQPGQLQGLAPRAQSAPPLPAPLLGLALQLLLRYLQHQGLRGGGRTSTQVGEAG